MSPETPAKAHSCPECGAPMVYEKRPDTIEYKGQSRTLQMLAWWCTKCREAIFEGQPLIDHERAYDELKAEAEAIRLQDLRNLIVADWEEYRAAREIDRYRWWLRRRVLPDGRILHIELMHRFYRLSVSPPVHQVFDHVYDYEADETAWTAILEWDGTGDPQGWFRHPQSGRQRPGGDPAREYVEPA